MKKILSAILLAMWAFAFFSQPLKRNEQNNGIKETIVSKNVDSKKLVFRDTDINREKQNNPPPFDFNSVDKLKSEIDLLLKNCQQVDEEVKDDLLKEFSEFEEMANYYRGLSVVSAEETMKLISKRYNVQNLLGLASKGQKKLSSLKYFQKNEKFTYLKNFRTEGDSKVNTGWILDQHIYDTTAEKYFPSIPSDIRSNDEGASDTEVDKDGWVWHVHSFYFSDTVEGDHPSPSYSLGVYVSPDGGATWLLYEVLYDPSSIDIINPRIAIDNLPSENRIFIAYEYAYSQTDHDIYVYSENLLSSTPNPQDAAIATSALLERNPDIASDYHQGQTSYRVVAYEAEASLGSYNIDIYARQSTGAGATADWSVAVAVAADLNAETNPSLSNGASGSTTFTQYMHLAYNYDILTPSQMLLNNGFESGNNGDWTVQNSDDIDCTSGYQRTGSCLAWFGGYNNYTGYIYQDIYIPTGALSASLSYYLRIQSDEGTTTAYDFFYAEIRDTSNALLTTLKSYSNKDKTTYASYQLQTFNILSYAGQTIRIYFRGTTDGSLITNFFLDDTALNVTLPEPSGYEVRYARAQHPGATPYPDGFQSFSKIVVLSNVGADFKYGPPSVIATHGGGSSTWTQGRVAVAAHQHFPADSPNSGDLERNQICFAWNMCNGGTTCGNMTCGSETITKNWQEAWFYDGRGDEQFPSLIQDGVGVLTSGLALHPYIYMAYFHRAADEPTGLGEIQLILADPSDETCDGFIYGYWYYFTNSYTATDPDNLVDPKERTINAFNYWDSFPGITFNKYKSHLGGGNNDDVFCTTIGDNYTFRTFSRGEYLDLNISTNGENYSTPHTFAWPAGYIMSVTAITPQEQSPYTYIFSNWSNDQTDPLLNVTTDFCDPVNPCPTVEYIATYFSSPLILSIQDPDNCAQSGIQIDYENGYGAAAHDLYQDGLLVVTNFPSGAIYNPNDSKAHSYFIRANFGTFYIDSQPYVAEDFGGVSPGEIVSESWSSDKINYSWTGIGSDNYRVLRGIQADLANLANSNNDGCLRYAGPNTVLDVSGDDPQSVAGKFYWYLIQGYNGPDPNSCVGSAGLGANGLERNVTWDGITYCN